MNKTIEKLKLEKIKEVIIKEQSRNYYDNGANIKEIIELNDCSYIPNRRAHYVENMLIFNNDMIKFNKFWLSFTGIEKPIPPYLRDRVKTKMRSRV